MTTSLQAEATPRHRTMQDAGLHRKVQQGRTVLSVADIEQPDTVYTESGISLCCEFMHPQAVGAARQRACNTSMQAADA
jgi:hypothetical protein